jgi:hypothetical protein
MRSRLGMVVIAAGCIVALVAGSALAGQQPVAVVATDKIEIAPAASQTYLAWMVLAGKYQ